MIDTKIYFYFSTHGYHGNQYNRNWMGLMLTKFDDILHIAPKGLTTIQIESNYQEILAKNIRRVYFNYVRVT